MCPIILDVCPIILQPPKSAVEYGTPFSANCSSDLPHDGIGWEVTQGLVEQTLNQSVTWRVENLTDWSIKPMCYINIEHKQCTAELNITVYSKLFPTHNLCYDIII